MRCIAIIEAERPGLDSAIIWEQDGGLVAFGYENGRVKMTRPLPPGATLDEAVAEVRVGFQINEAQLTKIHRWNTVDAQTLSAPKLRRWA